MDVSFFRLKSMLYFRAHFSKDLILPSVTSILESWHPCFISFSMLCFPWLLVGPFSAFCTAFFSIFFCFPFRFSCSIFASAFSMAAFRIRAVILPPFTHSDTVFSFTSSCKAFPLLSCGLFFLPHLP